MGKRTQRGKISMKLENGYEKLAEMLGLEMGQEFNIDGASHPDIPLYNPYKITTAGIFDKQGLVMMSYVLAPILYGQLAYEPIDKPLLTEEEKTCLINLREICGNIETVELTNDNDGVGRTVMYCVDDCEVCVAEIVVAPGLFDELERNREYTWEELGLED